MAHLKLESIMLDFHPLLQIKKTQPDALNLYSLCSKIFYICSLASRIEPFLCDLSDSLNFELVSISFATHKTPR